MSPEAFISEYQLHLGMEVEEELQGSSFQLEDPSRGWLFGIDSDGNHVIPFYAAPALYFSTDKQEEILSAINIEKQKRLPGLAVGLSEINNQEWVVVITRIQPKRASFDFVDDTIMRLQRFLLDLLN